MATADKSDPAPVASNTTQPSPGASPSIAGGGRAVQLKAALRGHDYATQVQMLAPDRGAGHGDAGADVHAAAAEGVRSGGGRLPYGEQIQRSFGGYDISNVVAHTGAAAEHAASAMGASAYATGNDVVLGEGGTDLHTVAHEAAHVVQQRAGVSLSGGVGQAGDPYERHADAVADLVVQGKSAEGLLAQSPGGGSDRAPGPMTAVLQKQESSQESVASTSADMTQEPNAQDSQNGANQSPEAVAKARIDALSALRALERSATDFVIAHYDWLGDNLSKYIQLSGGGVQIRFGNVAVDRLGATAARTFVGKVGSGLGGVVGNAISRGSAERGLLSLFNVTSGLTGAIIGVAWGFVDKQFEKARIQQLTHEAGQDLAAAIRASIDEAKGARDSHLAEWRAEADRIAVLLMNSNDAAFLGSMATAVRGYAESMEASTGAFRRDRSLCSEMLGEWLMQTAKDGRSGGKDVNPATYEAARSLALNSQLPDTPKDRLPAADPKAPRFEKGSKSPVATEPQLPPIAYARDRLFIAQCRYEWGKLGVDAGAILAYLEWIADNRAFDARGGAASQLYTFDKVQNANAMMSYLAKIGIVLPTTMRNEPQHGPDGKALTARNGSPLTRLRIGHELNANTTGRPRKILDAVMHGQVQVDCRLSVESQVSEQAAFVRKFQYSMMFITPHGGQERVNLETRP